MANLDQLRSTQSTPVLTPDDADYPQAVGTWGPPLSPDVLVRPTTPEEVGAALRSAAAEGQEVAVRSGAHGPWAPIPGGLLVDLGAFAQVEADGEVVHVGPGANWGDVADALATYDLVLSSGDTRSVGVGGNALGAGVGWLVRSVGLAVDQLVGAQLVAADGRVVEVSERENPELFFAIRGGGGNFGVATRLDFRAEHLGDVAFGSAPVDQDGLAATIRGVRDAMRGAPRELAVTLVKPPPMGPELPPQLEVLWAGDDEKVAREALAPILAVDGVGEADLHVVPYASALVEPPSGPPGPPPRMTTSNGLFTRLSDATADRVATALAAHPASVVDIRFLGGALVDVPKDATALAWRDAEALVHWIAFLPPDATPDDIARAGEVWAPVGEDADALLGTFTDDTGPEPVERMYPPATLERLRAVKREWDPENLFRRNHNITPS